MSVENVVATIDRPNNHQGISLPDKKNCDELFKDFLEKNNPIININNKENYDKPISITNNHIVLFI